MVQKYYDKIIKVRGSTRKDTIENKGWEVMSFKKVSPKMFELKVKKIPVRSHARRGTSGVISHRRLKPGR